MRPYFWNGTILRWLLSLVFIMSILALFPQSPSSKSLNSEATMTGIVGVIGSLFSLAQLQISKLQIFRDLFTDFNRRYDRMNTVLAAISQRYEFGQEEISPTSKDQKPRRLKSDRDILIDYFNLCAEEYLYYRRGLIPEEVWMAWRNGIRQLWEIPAIASLWVEQAKTGSYYNFDPEKQLGGATDAKSGLLPPKST